MIDRHPFVVRSMAIHVAERPAQHQRIEPGEQPDQPRVESSQRRGNAARNAADESEYPKPFRGTERVVAPGDPIELGRT
jgi:hypothetical protein